MDLCEKWMNVEDGAAYGTAGADFKNCINMLSHLGCYQGGIIFPLNTGQGELEEVDFLELALKYGAMTFKTIIEDDIWFKNKESIFYQYRNKEIPYQYYYEYYYNIKSGYVDVFPIIESEGQIVFCKISFGITNDNLEEGKFYDDKELSSYELENIQGSGTVSIGERRKPPYDADEDKVETVKENIRKYVEYEKELHAKYKMEWEMEDIYVRNFYQGAVNTMMIYTSKGKRYYTYIQTNGEYHLGGHEIEESQKEYYERLMECSFPLYD